MPIYAVTYTYTDDVATRDRVRPEHRAYLRELADQGVVLLSGPFGKEERAGGMLLVKAADKGEVAGMIEKDPFSANGVVSESETREWDPVIGPLREHV